jgi:hypothetical protein
MTTPDAATEALAQRLRKAYWDSRVLPRGEGETANWLAVAREAQRWAQELHNQAALTPVVQPPTRSGDA